MDRREELIEIVCRENATKAGRLIDEVVFLEGQLEDLKKLPFLKVNPDNPMKQKPTPAARLYKDTLNQYNNTLRLLLRVSGEFGDTEEESPLRAWVNSRMGKDVDG